MLTNLVGLALGCALLTNLVSLAFFRLVSLSVVSFLALSSFCGVATVFLSVRLGWVLLLSVSLQGFVGSHLGGVLVAGQGASPKKCSFNLDLVQSRSDHPPIFLDLLGFAKGLNKSAVARVARLHCRLTLTLPLHTVVNGHCTVETEWLLHIEEGLL